MKVQTEITGGAAHIRFCGREMVKGDADMVLRGALKELSEAGVRRIFLDLSRVREIDGACVQEILSWGRRMAGLGGELALINPGLHDVQSMVTLLRDLRSFPGREEALEAPPVGPGRVHAPGGGKRRVLDRIFGDQTTVLGVTA